MTVKRSENPYDLCTFTYADGRICGNPTIPSGGGLCRSHASLRRFRPIVDDELTADLPNFTGDIPSQEEIHRTITRVMQALAANRISTRRAATFGYLAQLLLQAHSAVKAEARMTELEGAKDLRMLLKMKYGSALRKEAEKRVAEAVAATGSSDQRPAARHPNTPTNPKST
jgi:hypothetical protein